MNPRNSLLRNLQFLIAASLCMKGAIAQTQIAVSERDYFEELPVVLSVSRLAQPLDEAPGAVTVIDRDMIRQSGARDLMDLFRLVPGFQVVKPPNSPGIVTYHGLGQSYPQQMQLLLDGRSMYSPAVYGGVNWNLIPVALDDIERIEVVRGSNSAAYGANAFLGIANIVTRNAADARGATAELRDGNQGVRDRFLRLGGGNDTASFRVSAQSQQDDGIVSIPDHGSKRLFDARADIRLGLRDELQAQFGAMDSGFNVGLTTSPTNPSRMQDWNSQYISIGWHRALEDSADVSVHFYRSEERMADAVTALTYDTSVGAAVNYLLNTRHYPPAAVAALIPNVPVTADYGLHSVRNNLEASHTFSPWQDARLVWGGELRSDSVRGFQYYGRSDAVALTVARIFGNLEWRLAKDWIANVGGTVEHDTNAGTSSAPRLALNWHVAPGQTLRAGISSAFRAPSLYESRGYAPLISSNGSVLYNLYQAKGTLLPERLVSRELGWIGEFKQVGMTADVRAFEEKIGDHIVTLPTYPVAPYCSSIALVGCSAAQASAFNAQDLTIRGVEYQLRWQPAEKTRLILSQAFVQISQQLRLPNDPSVILDASSLAAMQVQTDASAPTRNASVMLMQKLPGGFDLSATYYSVGALRWTQNNPVSGYTRLDWRLAYPFRVGPTRGELAFTVQGDGANHAEYRPVNVMSPRSYATLRLEY